MKPELKQEIKMSNSQENTQRLDRIEEKIDRLADAMISLARAEEKISGLQDDHDKMYERINRLSTKLDEISNQVHENSRTVDFIHKLFWVCIVSIAGAITANIWMLN